MLRAVRAKARGLGCQAVNPRWTSYGALEIDVFAPSREAFKRLLHEIEPLVRVEFYRELGGPAPARGPGEAVAEARRYFNQERFWECHEALEDVWHRAEGDERRLLQGIILVAAAFVHHQRGDLDAGLRVLKRAYRHLAWREGTYYGLDVMGLRRQVEAMLTQGRMWLLKL